MYRFLIIILFTFLNAQYINQETGWEFHQSSSQSFYIFESMQIDGENPEGDGWAPSLTLESECVDNPNSCDVVGAFLNDVCIGWVYADSNGGTTLPIMGYDDTNSQTQLNTENYCISGDIPEVKIFDSSTGNILEITSGDILPGWELNIAHVIYNISFANNGIIAPYVGWNFYQTSQQAFYLFENIIIDSLNAEADDIIGAFNDDVCVGWANVVENDFTSVPVMGAELDGYYSEYMNTGDIPIFMFYDYSDQMVYEILPSEELNTWANNSVQTLYGDSYVLIEEIVQDISLSTGWNMFSLNVNPINENVFDIIGPLHDNLLQVLDETGGAIFPFGDGFADNIGLWQSTEGYLIKISDDVILSISNDGIVELPLNIPLTSGWNIISYPAQISNDIELVLSSLLSNQNLQLVFNEAGNVYIPDYITGGDAVNSIVSFSSGEGYYVKVDNDDDLVITEPVFTFENDDIIVDYNSSRDEHFIPVWSGNPFQPMTIIMDNALWDGMGLQADDEIGVFDGAVCVGAYVVPDGGFPANANVEIATSKNDGSGNGYTEGNAVSFRVWHDSEEVDIDADINIFTDPSGNVINNVFIALSAPSAQIEVKAPSEPRNFNATGQTNQINLSWNRPSIGDYQVYNYPDPGNSNAVTFTITRDESIIIESLDASSFTDTGLDHNTEYVYTIVSESVVNTSASSTDDALTKPGVPILSLASGDNQITLTWQNPDVTGNDAVIDYNLYRRWNTGDSTYSENIANVNDQIYVDQGLLNTTAYEYRINAHNISGTSNYAEWQESSTNIPSGNMLIIENILDTTYQTIFPPENVIQLTWENNNDATLYRIYERNLLLGTSMNTNYIDPENEIDNLETSTVYRYVVTGVNDNGDESSPSELIEVTTLPEYIPDAPDSLLLYSGQNNISLSWESVPGYGDPIGGAAEIYNIYRFNIDDFDLDSISVDNIVGSVSGVNSTSYTDSNLNDNAYYCYGVSGVNSEGNEGPLSDILCEITQNQLSASTPTNLTATGGNQQVSLSWSESSGSPNINYQIYRSGDGFSDEFVIDVISTSYTDAELARNTAYTYYVVAWNELGPSASSLSVDAVTTSQSDIRAAQIPENLQVYLDDNARASNYIDGYAQIEWDSREYAESPFNLAYSGNPYSPHTIIIENLVFEDTNLQVDDGDVIAVFDNQLCVGFGTWPLPNGQMSASKDDGSGNGFTDGAPAYFQIWDISTGHIHTAVESPSFTLTGLGLDYIDLLIYNDTYTLYRNGEMLAADLSDESYQDNELEGEMDYVYAVAAKNILGSWTLSNASSQSLINTDNYIQSAPELNAIQDQIIDEDDFLIIELSATDADEDVITYFAEVVSAQSPIECSIEDNVLTLTPSQNHNGSFDVRVIAYDDFEFYESNTLSDSLIFNLSVEPVNDNPVLLNSLNDIHILEGEFQDSLFISLVNIFNDVDVSIMSQDSLEYSLELDNNESVIAEIFENNLLVTIISSGETEITVTATDLSGVSISDSFDIIIDNVLSADLNIWPEEFTLSSAYPNPFNPVTNFHIEIPEFSQVSIKVYDVSGRMIDRILEGNLAKGTYEMQWDAHGFPSGIYFISLLSEKNHITNKVILLK